MNTWTTTDDYDRQYAETADPRVLLIIERYNDDNGPDGDALAPAYWIEYRGEWRSSGRAGYTFEDDDAMAAYLRARNATPYGNDGRTIIPSDEFAARFMRIFHDTTVAEVSSRVERDETVIILNTPAFRVHVGLEDAEGNRVPNGAGDPITDDVALSLEGETAEFQAWLDRESYSIGYAVNMARVLPSEDAIDLEDGNWTVEIESYGYRGEEWAREAAAELSGPDLPPLLDLPACA